MAEARFWVDRNVARWNEVLERERRDVAREAFTAGRYALADIFFAREATLRRTSFCVTRC